MAEIDIQIMDPAAVSLPLSVQNLAFMNRTVYPSLLYPDTAKWTDEEFSILDTVMNNWIFQGVKNSMDDSPLYDFESIRIVQVRRSDTAGLLIPLEKSILQKLKNVSKADAIISLEYYFIKDSVRMWSDYELGYHEAYLGLNTITLWRIYDLNNNTILDEIALNETTDWFRDDETLIGAASKLPQAVDGIRQAAYNVGVTYGLRISPTWKETQRFFYSSGGIEMRRAAGKINSGDWYGAAELWRKLAYGEHQKTAARACFNMALFCEMEDQLILALDWAVKAYTIKQDKLTKEYIDLLKQRYSDGRRLKKQLPSNSEFLLDI
ncbi:MAG TPA: hypothetical protein ENI20_18325 [Bacteroides sp.]|nr:hypothetical protein [Bacteroides sp.]